MLACLHWLLVGFHVKVLVMTYKALNSLRPQYLLERFSHKIAMRPIRSSQSLMLKIMTPAETKRANTRKCAFSVMVLWNKLPAGYILLSFRKSITMELYKATFTSVLTIDLRSSDLFYIFKILLKCRLFHCS